MSPPRTLSLDASVPSTAISDCNACRMNVHNGPHIGSSNATPSRFVETPVQDHSSQHLQTRPLTLSLNSITPLTPGGAFYFTELHAQSPNEGFLQSRTLSKSIINACKPSVHTLPKTHNLVFQPRNAHPFNPAPAGPKGPMPKRF